MGYMTDGLTFNALREANTLRLPQFKNRRGEPAHSKPDGSDWCLAQWCNAVSGELGEAANLIKKIERGDMTLDEARDDLGREFADIVTYLDILAFRAGVNLGRATMQKFNEISERVGSDVRLDADGAHRVRDCQEQWQTLAKEIIAEDGCNCVDPHEYPDSATGAACSSCKLNKLLTGSWIAGGSDP